LAANVWPVAWTSDDESVVTVDSAGVVTAVGKGVASVRGAVKEVEGLTTITVNPDRSVLVEIHEALGGSGWRRDDNWGTDAPLDKWYGVTADSEGNVGRTFTLARDDSFFGVEAVLPGGAILSSDWVSRGGLSDGLSRTEETYRVRDAEGDMVSFLGSFRGTEWFSSWSGSSGWSVEIPHAHRISTFAWGDLVAIAPNDTYEIRVFGLDGTLKRIVRRDHDLVASTKAHIDAEIEDRVARRPEEERAERRQERPRGGSGAFGCAESDARCVHL